MKLFKIVFDNINGSYFAGQVVTGKVLIHLNKSKKIKALKIRCVGRAEVRWTERSGKTSNSYQSSEPYFWFERTLLGEEAQEPDIILPPGENSYAFQIQLPGGIPSSFQGAYGHVQYFLKATMTRPWKFAQKVSSYFTVNGFLDLNRFGHAGRAVTVSKWNSSNSTFIGWLCCWSSGIGFKLSLDKTGFVPGDSVRFNIRVENVSSHPVSTFTITLIQVTAYKDLGRRREKCERKVVNELHGPSVGAKSSSVWDSETTQDCFKIPPLPPTNLGGGSIISVQYYLCVTLKLARLFEATTVEGKVQLIIGTVPYRNFFEELMPSFINAQRQQAIVASQENVEAEQPTGASSLSLDLNIPPPTYEEAMELYKRYGSAFPSPSAPMMSEEDGSPENPSAFGEEDEAGDGRPFNPLYATYDWRRRQREGSEQVVE